MLTRVLIPLDGSELAEAAIQYACALSTVTAAALVLVRVVRAGRFDARDPATSTDQALNETQQYLEHVAADLRGRAFETITAAPLGGDTAARIVEQVEQHGANLVVMATHGRTGPRHWVLGSVAEAVLGTSPVPIVVVRAWQQHRTTLLLQDRPRLLVPLDGSDFSEAALPAAAELADDLNGELVLTRIERVPRGPMLMDGGRVLILAEDREAVLRLAGQTYLTEVAERLMQTYPALTISTDVRCAEPAAGIADAAEAANAALIVMATHGRTGLERVRLGSVAGETLHAGRVPLVLIRPADVGVGAPPPS
jgi:nucleotide-binding universal stress UspA family protein